MLKTILRYYHTLKYLKWQQVYYRIYYFLRQKVRRLIGFELKPSKTCPLIKDLPKMIPSIDSSLLYDSKEFLFLNLRKELVQPINWNFSEYGKLWTYNLNYFEYLHQKIFDTTFALSLIQDFIKNNQKYAVCSEPFPVSLRIINWIKYFLFKNIKNNDFDKSLYTQLNILADNLEYHLLGNHLLENGFALLFGSIYFQDEFLFKTANRILSSELNEQILSDGAHFELCPMYHQIMLFRVLDCYNLLKNNSIASVKTKSVLETLLKNKAGIMLGWLYNMTYQDGSIPHFGDSADGIAPTSNSLFDYAKRLDIMPNIYPLSDSGYRKLKNKRFELTAKVGQIGPDYIPGHAHADSLSFELRIDNLPFLVDTGISTYEKNAQRQLERSTASHNTVNINDANSSQVWGGFRVAKRAYTRIVNEKLDTIEAEHNGYQSIGVLHQRRFEIQAHAFIIKDTLESDRTDKIMAKAYLHFHSSVNAYVIENQIITANASIDILDSTSINIVDSYVATGFNQLQLVKKVEVCFNKQLQIVIVPK